MSTSPITRRCYVARCLLVAAVAVVPLACTSDRSAITTTTASTTSTTSTSTTTSTSSTTTTTLPPTTTTTEPLITQPGIVKVANASGIDGAAAALTGEFAALGFDTRDGTNAAGIDKDLETSKIYVIAGSEPVAESISRLMGGLAITRMPTPAWIKGGTAGLGDATVLVMLGHDLAGTALADIR
jgi:hypothetical protein